MSRDTYRGLQRQKLGVMCAAFCSGPMSAFVDAAVSATAAVCASPLWSSLPCKGTIGASATKYRLTSPERHLQDLASWLHCNPLAEHDIFAFDLCGGEEPFNPEQRVEVVADIDAARPNTTVRHLFELQLPVAALTPQRLPENLRYLMKALQRLPFESCYVSPAISWSRHAAFGRADGSHAAEAIRNPALDVHANATTRFVIGGRCRGAKWLVLLNDGMVGKLADDALLDRLRGGGLHVSALPGALAIQVTPDPFEPVTHRSDALRRYRALARELEDITLFDDLALERARCNQDPELLDRYERRFLQ